MLNNPSQYLGNSGGSKGQSGQNFARFLSSEEKEACSPEIQSRNLFVRSFRKGPRGTRRFPVLDKKATNSNRDLHFARSIDSLFLSYVHTTEDFCCDSYL
jgi:hypothetical protein